MRRNGCIVPFKNKAKHLFIYLFICCVCVCMWVQGPQSVCGSQRSTCGSWSSPSIKQAPGTELRFLRLPGRLPFLLKGLLSPQPAIHSISWNGCVTVYKPGLETRLSDLDSFVLLKTWVWFPCCLTTTWNSSPRRTGALFWPPWAPAYM